MNIWWIDPRLQHNGSVYIFSFQPEDHIWYPELMVLNSANNQRVGKDVVTKIHPSGQVHVNQR